MKLGIIGAGNMGSSILKGVTASNFLENKNIAIFDLNKEKIATFLFSRKFEDVTPFSIELPIFPAPIIPNFI